MGRQNTYANPFILERADPFMIKADDGWYYFTASYPMKRGDDPEGYDRVILRRSKTVDGLREAEEITIWQADENADLLDIAAWTKFDRPLLTSEDLVDEYGPGHNSFTKDEEGNDIFVYHARSKECFEGKCGYSDNDPLQDPCRHARIHTVEWTADGKPILNGREK